MKNQKFIGDSLTLIVGVGEIVKSGDIVLRNDIIAIASNDGIEGDEITGQLEGVFEVPKEAPLVISMGDKLYFDATAKKVTKTAMGNTPCGHAYQDALSAATTAYLRLAAL